MLFILLLVSVVHAAVRFISKKLRPGTARCPLRGRLAKITRMANAGNLPRNQRFSRTKAYASRAASTMIHELFPVCKAFFQEKTVFFKTRTKCTRIRVFRGKKEAVFQWKTYRGQYPPLWCKQFLFRDYQGTSAP